MHTCNVGDIAEDLDENRVTRIVRIVHARSSDGLISVRDLDGIFDVTRTDDSHRDAVLRRLPEAGVQIVPDEPGPTSVTDTPSNPVSADDVAAARQLLDRDSGRRKPWTRILEAREEVGLAVLVRGPDIPLDHPLPEGYRTHLGAGDERARAFDALMLHNIRLVWSIARVYADDGLEAEDIAQHGMLGLRRAVEKFDATKGYKFSTYASWWIRQAITRGIANDGRLIRLPVHMTERMKKVLSAQTRLFTRTGESRLADLVDETGLSPDESLNVSGWLSASHRSTNLSRRVATVSAASFSSNPTTSRTPPNFLTARCCVRSFAALSTI